MRARWAHGLAIGLCLAALGCGGGTHITDGVGFCKGIAATPLPTGARVIVADSTYVTTPVANGAISSPLRNVEVILTEEGGIKQQLSDLPDPNEGIGVCAGDCADAADNLFHARVRATTDDNGVLLYTAFVGPYAAGFVFMNFGDVTCVQQVGGATLIH